MFSTVQAFYSVLTFEVQIISENYSYLDASVGLYLNGEWYARSLVLCEDSRLYLFLDSHEWKRAMCELEQVAQCLEELLKLMFSWVNGPNNEFDESGVWKKWPQAFLARIRRESDALDRQCKEWENSWH